MSLSPEPDIAWRGGFASDEVGALHAEAFDHAMLTDDWWAQVNAHSLGWVTGRAAGALVGFANLTWDGGVHAFLIDVMVAADFRRQGLGARLVAAAAEGARAAGCEWLHVDFEDHLTDFYFQACGFRPAPAGLMALKPGR